MAMFDIIMEGYIPKKLSTAKQTLKYKNFNELERVEKTDKN